MTTDAAETKVETPPAGLSRDGTRRGQNKKKPAYSAPDGIRQGDWPAPAPAVDTSMATLIAQVAALTAKLEAVEGNTGKTQFVPMKHEAGKNVAGTYQPPEAITARALKGLQRAGDTTTGRTGLFNNPEFLKKIPPQYRPAFKSGDAVRINPDALIHGSDKTWGPLLEEKKIDGRGEVLCIQYITKTWEPKYTVHIPGLTRKDGTGLRESVLLPV